MLLPELQVVAKLLISKIVQNGFVFLCVCELSTFSTDAADRFLDTIDLRVGFLGHVSLTLFLYPALSQRDWTSIASRRRLRVPLRRFRPLPLLQFPSTPLLNHRNGEAGSHFPLFFCVPAVSERFLFSLQIALFRLC